MLLSMTWGCRCWDVCVPPGFLMKFIVLLINVLCVQILTPGSSCSGGRHYLLLSRNMIPSSQHDSSPKPQQSLRPALLVCSRVFRWSDIACPTEASRMDDAGVSEAEATGLDAPAMINGGQQHHRKAVWISPFRRNPISASRLLGLRIRCL